MTMKKTIATAITGFLLASAAAGDAGAYARDICYGYGTGRVHVHLHAGPRYHRQDNELVFLLLLSSTSTSIYCLAVADDEEQRRYTRRRRFSHLNYEQLRHDGARGQGEYLAALSSLMGCPPERLPEFGASVQKRYPILFPAADTFEAAGFINQLQTMIADTPRLKAACRPDSIIVHPM